jgi:hypothetical protein
MRLHRLRRRRRRCLTPQRIDDHIDADDLADAARQQGQQATTVRTGHMDRLPATFDHQRPEHEDADHTNLRRTAGTALDVGVHVHRPDCTSPWLQPAGSRPRAGR